MLPDLRYIVSSLSGGSGGGAGGGKDGGGGRGGGELATCAGGSDHSSMSAGGNAMNRSVTLVSPHGTDSQKVLSVVFQIVYILARGLLRISVKAGA